MSLLRNLHASFSVDATEPASTEAEIAALLEFAARLGIEVPGEYVELVREASEIELAVGEGYIRIWSASGTVEMNEAYEVQKYLPGALAIGDDEGGKAFAIMKGKDGAGVYRFPFSDPDFEEATFIAPSLHDLLQKAVGVDRLFDE